MTHANEFKCGYIALVGRPNTGKSTLLNRFVGEKISIISHKPQTTRHRILGIKTAADWQMIFVDTPGFHLDQSRAINQYMNKTALSAVKEVDIILFVVQADRWKSEDKALLEKLKKTDSPIIAVINKIDLLKDKAKLLPFLEHLNQQHSFFDIIPVSAKKQDGIDVLEKKIAENLPIAEPYYDDEQLTDKSLRFLAAERIREQLFLSLQDELPYALTVEIEDFSELPDINHISAVIWVERSSHKSIVIGRQGEGLKTVGRLARQSMQALFDKKVFLRLWVKVKAGWSDDTRALQSLGYNNDTE